MKTSPSQLKRQKFGGFMLPILLEWFLIVLVVALTLVSLMYWKDWFNLPIIATWLLLTPTLGYGMGNLSAYCWQEQEWDEQTYREKSSNLLIYFWALSPVTYLLFFSGFGIAILPIHGACFFKGQDIGKRWAETDMLNQFWAKAMSGSEMN